MPDAGREGAIDAAIHTVLLAAPRRWAFGDRARRRWRPKGGIGHHNVQASTPSEYTPHDPPGEGVQGRRPHALTRRRYRACLVRAGLRLGDVQQQALRSLPEGLCRETPSLCRLARLERFPLRRIHLHILRERRSFGSLWAGFARLQWRRRSRDLRASAWRVCAGWS
jgi:hypothetical protein